MGTNCQVVVWASSAESAEALASLGVQRVEILEQCWSRFRATSELSMLNAQAGKGAIAASDDLVRLVRAMRDAWIITDGLFDPTVLPAMNAWGYDATSHRCPTSFAEDIPVLSVPGMADVLTSDTAVELPAGVNLDPGAIGKGLGADIVSRELHDAGADGVLVDLGGDISWRGLPSDGMWHFQVRDERTGEDRWEIFTADEGGLATSTTKTRRWAQGRHHVIDPRTGAPSVQPAVQSTVLASRAVIAEIVATAALLTDNTDELFERTNTAGLVLTETHEHVAPHFLARKELSTLTSRGQS